MILNGGVYKGKRYLSEAAVKEMRSKQTGDAIHVGYGFGWSVASGASDELAAEPVISANPRFGWSTYSSTFGHGGAFLTNMNIDRSVA